jgi:hypothetical protein
MSIHKHSQLVEGLVPDEIQARRPLYHHGAAHVLQAHEVRLPCTPAAAVAPVRLLGALLLQAATSQLTAARVCIASLAHTVPLAFLTLVIIFTIPVFLCTLRMFQELMMSTVMSVPLYA